MLAVIVTMVIFKMKRFSSRLVRPERTCAERGWCGGASAWQHY